MNNEERRQCNAIYIASDIGQQWNTMSSQFEGKGKFQTWTEKKPLLCELSLPYTRMAILECNEIPNNSRGQRNKRRKATKNMRNSLLKKFHQNFMK